MCMVDEVVVWILLRWIRSRSSSHRGHMTLHSGHMTSLFVVWSAKLTKEKFWEDEFRMIWVSRWAKIDLHITAGPKISKKNGDQLKIDDETQDIHNCHYEREQLTNGSTNGRSLYKYLLFSCEPAPFFSPSRTGPRSTVPASLAW